MSISTQTLRWLLPPPQKFARRLAAACGYLFLAIAVFAQSPKTEYPVSAFELSYGRENPQLPALSELSKVQVKLVREENAFAAPSTGGSDAAIATVALGDLPPESRFSESGLKTVLQALVNFFNTRGLFGVFAVPRAEDIDSSTKVDYRPPTRRALGIVIWVSEIGQLRVVDKGTPLRNALRERIRKGSPLQAPSESKPGDFLRRAALENYLWRLNDNLGRQVEASVTSTNDPGLVALDYLVNEVRPWTLFAQASNTGTPATGRIRSRLSFASNETTADDDVLSLDYFTTSFNGSQAVFASYKRPLLFPNRLSTRVYGSWGNFNAQPVGLAFEGFSGNNWSGGAELSAVLARPLGVTVEAVGGARWQHFSVISRTFNNTGDANLFLPYVGADFRARNSISQMSGSFRLETNIPEIGGTHRAALENLGRLDTDAFWWTARGDLSGSVFIDALLRPRNSRRLHELYASIRGQYSPGSYRLIPQELEVVGGFFSVRGYPEALSAADSAYAATIEYRFHAPRLLKPRPEPKTFFGRPFRLQPRRVGDDTDWDLIFRMFGDAGQTFNNRIRLEEQNQTLVSAGSGLELSIGRHFNLRVDLGYAFKDVSTELEKLAKRGSVRLHAITTIAW